MGTQAPLGVTVIGVGSMGKRHAENVRRSTGFRLLGIVDVRSEVARQVAEQLECPFWTTHAEEALAHPDCRAVIIATTANTHPELITLAARYRRDILCEKPLALTVELADQCVATAAAAGSRLQVGFMRRFDPGYARAKSVITSGRIGSPLLFHAISRDRTAGLNTPEALRLHGGIFLDSAIHDYDLARWLMESEVVEVSAIAGSLPLPTSGQPANPNAGIVQLRFASGGLGVAEVYSQAHYGYDIRTEVIGSHSSIRVDQSASSGCTLLTPESVQSDFVGDYLERFAAAYEAELRDWGDRMRNDQPPAVPGEEGAAAVRISLAARQAAATGERIRLS
ncbi:MAG: Gfo/Idh/MocA family oxidoreductase [Chloroflexi bacterium]|nr:Gfo/Idh/MocA family oxidoreductase [Chloroflexota bacterium]